MFQIVKLNPKKEGVVKRPVIAEEKHFAELDDRVALAVLFDGRAEVSSAPSSEFLGSFLNIFPDLTIEQGRKIVNYYRRIARERPRVKAAWAEFVETEKLLRW